jgi:hypothetical protein
MHARLRQGEQLTRRIKVSSIPAPGEPLLV